MSSSSSDQLVKAAECAATTATSLCRSSEHNAAGPPVRVHQQPSATIRDMPHKQSNTWEGRAACSHRSTPRPHIGPQLRRGHPAALRHSGTEPVLQLPGAFSRCRNGPLMSQTHVHKQSANVFFTLMNAFGLICIFRLQSRDALPRRADVSAKEGPHRWVFADSNGY